MTNEQKVEVKYPNKQPIICTMYKFGERLRVLDHGYVDELTARGCIVTPLIALTPELVAAIELYTDTFGGRWHDWPELEGAYNMLRAVLAQVNGDTNADS